MKTTVSHRPSVAFPSRRLLSLLAVLLAVLSGARAQDEDVTVYGAEFFTSDAVVEVKINGFPFATLPVEGNQSSDESFIGRFLKSGRNQIELIQRPFAAEGEDPPPAHLFFVELRTFDNAEEFKVISRVERITDATAEEPSRRTAVVFDDGIEALLRTKNADGDSLVVADADTRSTLHQPGVGALSKVHLLFTGIGLTEAVLPWELPFTPPTPEEIGEMRTRVVALRNAIAVGNAFAIDEILQEKHRRYALSIGQTEAEVSAVTQEVLEATRLAAGFELDPLQAVDIEFFAYPGLNLIQARKAGAPAISGRGVEIEYAFAPYFSKIDDNWVLIE